jgi:hypothetical protein
MLEAYMGLLISSQQQVALFRHLLLAILQANGLVVISKVKNCS